MNLNLSDDPDREPEPVSEPVSETEPEPESETKLYDIVIQKMNF